MANDVRPRSAPQTNSAKSDPPRADLEWTEANTLNVQISGDWSTLTEATGSATVLNGVLIQTASLGAQGKRIDATTTDFALGFVDAMKPRDAAEVLLLSQMAATHQATMMLARHLNHVDTIPQKDCAEKALNKTARTFAAQMDTLKRYRSKGKQVVRVERVNVAEGGKAIVGNVEAGGRADDET